MASHEDDILRIAAGAGTPLFSSEIAHRLNHELGSRTAYTAVELATHLQALSERVVQSSEGGGNYGQAIARNLQEVSD